MPRLGTTAKRSFIAFVVAVVSSVASMAGVYGREAPRARDALERATRSERDDRAFDYAQSARMLWLAGAAYCDRGLANWTCAYCPRASRAMRDVSAFEHARKNVKAYAGYDDDVARAVVAFRGTDPRSLENWMENLDAMHANAPEAKANDGAGRVHAGFQDAYESVRKGLIAHLIELRSKYDHMWRHFEVEITGHSLGGALATLLAVELDALGFKVVRVTTFGSPRVGDWMFADYYGKKLGNSTFRITHGRDAVPQLPPRIVGYHHVATEVFQNSTDGYVVCDGSGEDPKGSDGEWMHASLSDHLSYLGLPVCGCNADL